MAKEVNRRVNVFINGKEVENNIKSIRAAMSHLTNQLSKMDRGSAEYNQTLYKLAKLRAIYDEHTKSIKSTTDAIRNMSKANKENAESLGETKEELDRLSKRDKDFVLLAGAASSAIQGVNSAYQKVISSAKEYIDAFSTLDEAMTNVSKYTGLSKNEVEALNEALQKIDTRTPIEKLNALAADAGRLGITSQQAIQDFVEAGDIINVSLGEDLGEDAVKNIGKMAQMFGESDTLGLRGAMIATASAVNSLGQSSSASEPYIMEFTSRLAGVANTAGITQANIMGIASAMDQNMGQVERSSTAVQKVLMDMMSKTEQYADLVGMTSDEFKKLVDSDMNAAFLSVLDALNSISQQGGSALAQTLSDLKLKGSGVQDTLMTLAKKTDQLREAQANATAAYADGKSVLNEYAAANNNAAAELEKQQNQINIAKANLGKEIYPIYLKLINATLAFSNKTVSLVKHLKAHSEILIMIGALFAKKIKYYSLLTMKQIAHTAAKVKDIVVTKAHAVATNLSTIRLAAECIAHDVATKKITIHRAALEMLNIVMKKTPWGLITAGIATVVTGIIALTKHTRESKAATEEFNSTVAKEQSEVDYLFNKLKNAEKGTDEYKEALQQLIDKYPEVMSKHIDEKGRLDDINRAYQDIIQSIKTKTALDMKEKQITAANEKAINDQTEAYRKLKNQLLKNGAKNEDVADALVRDVQEKLKAGESEESIFSYLRSQGITHINTDSRIGTIGKTIDKIIDSEKELQKTTKDIEKTYDPFIQKTKSDLEEIEEQIRKLESQRNAAESSDDKKNIQKQIDLLKEQIRLKKEAQKTTSNPSTSSPTSTSSSTSKTDPIADFEKKLKDFRTRQQQASLEGWDKTKQGIIDSYQEMIDKANELNQKQTAKDLETERDNAIKAAGQKYIKDANEAFDKILEEADKNLQSSEQDGEENKILAAVAGTQKQWDEKIEEVRANTKIIQDILNEDLDLDDNDPGKLTADQRSVFEEGLRSGLEAEEQLTTNKMQAINNVIKQNVADEAQFITDKETELRRSRMTDYDRQIDEINALYDAKIEAKRKEIETLQQLQQQDGADTEGIQQQIDDIEKLIAKLENLKGNETSNFKKNYYNNVWDNLLNIDWKSFKDNWRDNLQTMTAALQEFANAAFDIFNSINQIQSNRENAAFDEWCDIQDQKADALQQQLDDGLISQQYYDAQMAKMGKEKEAKEKKIQHDQFEREKKANIIQATINGALAIVTAFAQLGPIAGAISAAITAATTAAQIAVMASQPNPYAKGGYIRKEQVALMGEEGEEWVASHKLVTDKKTAPVIAALEAYQRGDQNALNAITEVAEPNWKKVSQSSKELSRTFAPLSQSVTNVYNTNSNNTTTTTHSDNSELLKEIRQMNAFLKDPKNRQAYISRKMQLEYERQENELKEMTRL